MPTLPHPLYLPLFASVELPVLNEIIVFLLAAIGVALLSKALRFPYTVGLVVVGLLIGVALEQGWLFGDDSLSGREHFRLTQEMILLVFLPPLLFDGAMHTSLRDLRRSLLTIFSMAFLGTMLSSIIVGAAVHWLFQGISWEVALLIGVILSPTDPVSVIAIFREQGVDKRLAVLVEGESLFNDGVGVVAYLLLLGAVAGGGLESLEPLAACGQLGWMVGVGALVGTGLGMLANWILGRIDDPMVEVLASIVLAYGSYLLAEQFHASGVIAVVLAGLLLGNVGKHTAMSPATLHTLEHAWEVLAFLANSLVFLAMGFTMEAVALGKGLGLAAMLFLATLVARAIITYGIGGGCRWVRKEASWTWLHVLNWGGLKGTIPVALALGLPADLAEYRTPVYGVVLLSLLIQGLSFKTLLTRLGLLHGTDAEREHELAMGRSIMIEAALDELRQLEALGEVTPGLRQELESALEQERQALSVRVEQLRSQHEGLAALRQQQVARQLLLRQRSALDGALSRGRISEHTLVALRSELDQRMVDGKLLDDQ